MNAIIPVVAFSSGGPAPQVDPARLQQLETQLAAGLPVSPVVVPLAAAAPSAPRASRAVAATGIRQIHVSRLIPNPRNKRKVLTDIPEMAASIRVHGVMQPLIAEPAAGGKYMLIAGHRRLAGAKRAGLDMVPVNVRPPAVHVSRDTVLMLVENCQRVDLTAMEKAEAFGELRDTHHWSVTQIGQATGFAASTVSRYLTLLDLDDESQDRVRDGVIGVGQALDAVRDARAARRRSPGRGPGEVQRRPQARLEAPWFTRFHPLAASVSAACGHTERPRLSGGVDACGQCWEAAIRADALRRVPEGRLA